MREVRFWSRRDYLTPLLVFPRRSAGVGGRAAAGKGVRAKGRAQEHASPP